MKKRFLAWITAALLVIMTIVPPTVFAESEGMPEAEIENGSIIETEDTGVENEDVADGEEIEYIENEETESAEVTVISDNLTVSATYTEEAEEVVADEEVFALVDAESSTESVELLTVEETESMTVEDRQDEEAEEVQAQDADESVTVDNEEAASEPDEEQEIAEEAPENLAEELPVIVDEKEVSASWLNAALGMSGSLSGNWGKDMLAIARTQVGYRENEIDYIIDDNGVKHGKSLYGVIFGEPYREWSAMLVSFCVKYANIDYKYLPFTSQSDDMIRNFKHYGAYEDEEENYVAAPGDLVFFSSTVDGVSVKRVGIVESADDSEITVIEGDSENCVRVNTYIRSDGSIIGYANIEKYMNIRLETSEEAEIEAASEMDGEIKIWAEEVSATEEMIARAENAKSLESIVFENDCFIYVRTGSALARFDQNDGRVYDIATGLPVAVYDIESGVFYPLFEEENQKADADSASETEVTEAAEN